MSPIRKKYSTKPIIFRISTAFVNRDIHNLGPHQIGKDLLWGIQDNLLKAAR